MVAKRVKGFASAFTDRWNALSLTQKILAGTMILALMLSSFFLFQTAQDDYEVLYSNLSLEDAAAIAAKLKEQKKPFKVAADGTTILAPRGEKNALILETAGELTSEKTVNLTQIPPVVSGEVQKEWIKKLNANTIIAVLKSISGIKNAQVIISQPDHALFADDEEPPTASVMLMVEPGFRLREEQVKTIKNLVSHAVPGLKPENVAIADNAGNTLEGANSPSGIISTGETRRKQYEDETAKKVLKMLAPVVGKDNVVVAVSAILNFDQAQTNIHRIIPAGGDSETPTGVAISTQKQTEEYANGKKKAAGGEPGVESNAAPSYPSQEDEQKENKDNLYKFNKSTTNYEISKEDKTVVYAPGAIDRLTVAVVLNKVLTAQETEEIRDLVANAAGVDLARGDSIDIKGFQFSQPLTDKEKDLNDTIKQDQEKAFWLHLATIIVIGLMVVVALVVFYLLIKQPAEGELVEQEEEPYPFFEPQEAMIESTPVPILEAKLDPEMELMRESINGAVEKDPVEAARLLVTYMKDM
ncbi:MAG: flagellar M-ring protein FliF [Vampirovibrionales bacterium]|nr:flagellar M-ring protein FliF [Vampirovibrionales bacterium]